MRTLIATLGLWTLCHCATSIGAQAEASAEGPVLRAMRDEMRRSLTDLRLGNDPPPYFIAYRIDEIDLRAAQGSLGALALTPGLKLRYGTVELRVGSYDLDNSNFSRATVNTAGSPAILSLTEIVALDDDYDRLRWQLWLMTDTLYKTALEQLAQKRATIASQTPEERLPDLSREQPFDNQPGAGDAAAVRGPVVDVSQLEMVVRETSAVFRNMPSMVQSRADYLVSSTTSWYLNSEGSRYRRTHAESLFAIEASARAEDGRHVQNFRAVYGKTPADLPSREALVRQARELRAELEQLRSAPGLEANYSGPVLFEGQAAAELWLQGLVPALIGARASVVADEQLARQQQSLQNLTFTGRIGNKVLPEVFSVVDDPTLQELRGVKALAGQYAFDLQAVPARRKVLIERGVLRELLVDRNSLIDGVTRSSGNTRDGRTIMPSNIVVSADKAAGGIKVNQSDADLLKLLRNEIKARKAEFGMVIRRIDAPVRVPAISAEGVAGELQVQPAIVAHKVFADGREELVRNVELRDLTLRSFMNVIAVGQPRDPYTSVFSHASNRMFAIRNNARLQPSLSPGFVSASVPSMLVNDINLGKPRGSVPMAPKIPAPE